MRLGNRQKDLLLTIGMLKYMTYDEMRADGFRRRTILSLHSHDLIEKKMIGKKWRGHWQLVERNWIDILL